MPTIDLLFSDGSDEGRSWDSEEEVLGVSAIALGLSMASWTPQSDGGGFDAGCLIDFDYRRSLGTYRTLGGRE